MGLFSKKPAPAAPIQTQAAPVASTPAPTGGLSLSKGKISLDKGSAVTIAKTAVIRAKATWSSNTDYDLYALVLLKNGQILTVATFGSEAEPNPTDSVLNGAVRHLGDIGRGVKGLAEETIEIRLTDEIEAIFPIAYSAQSNGTGSFRKYNVSLSIDNGEGDEVTINATNANNNNTIYSVGIGVIRNTALGVKVEYLENYSQPNSENRPLVVNGQLVMDQGSRNLYK
jgi:tellurite resistance protein TerA